MTSVERVWDYPRPPAVVRCEGRVRVELAGEVLADSTGALRVLETSHPPTIYVPPAGVRGDLLAVSSEQPTWCEFKGAARHVDAIIQGRRFKAVGWSYPDPLAGYEALRGCVAFYPGRVDGAWIDDERVEVSEAASTEVGSPPAWSARSRDRQAPSDREARARMIFLQRFLIVPA